MAARSWSLVEAVRARFSGRLIGNVDGVRGERLSGWLFDLVDPQRRLMISISTASGRSLRVLADRYRADVHRSGQGDGYCGFSVPVAHLGDTTGMRVFCESPRVALKVPRGNGSPTRLPSESIRQGSCRLNVDKSMPGTVSGWVFDEAEPELRRLVLLRHEGQLVTQQRATLYRPEAAAACGDGFHGFSLVVPGPGPMRLVIADAASGLYLTTVA